MHDEVRGLHFIKNKNIFRIGDIEDIFFVPSVHGAVLVVTQAPNSSQPRKP